MHQGSRTKVPCTTFNNTLHCLMCAPCKKTYGIFPGQALHETGLQRQIGVGTLVSSQERRAAVVPRISRGSTGYQPVVNRSLCSSIGLHRVSVVRVFEGTFRTVVLGALEGKRVGRFLGEPTRRRPVLTPPPPCHTVLPCAALPRPARGMSGFWIRQVLPCFIFHVF